MSGKAREIDQQTIADFGRQWTAFRDSTGHFCSVELLADILGPLLPLAHLQGKRVAEIGSGAGRIVAMLLNAGAASVVALEPSAAIGVLEENLREYRDRVTMLHMTRDRLPPTGDFDYVLSIGVLHHIVEPGPTAAAAYNALKPRGQVIAWLYGREGSGLYLATLGLLRSLTRRLPHSFLAALSYLLVYPLDLYVAFCRFFPLPLRDYALNVLRKFTRDKRRLVIYDQLGPAYAKYYSESEARSLLENAGFVDVRLHHRHGYSWTVSGTRPIAPS